jgi:hypothetical protein
MIVDLSQGTRHTKAHISRHGLDPNQPLDLVEILDKVGLSWALWCTQFLPQHSVEWREFAIRCARRAFPDNSSLDLLVQSVHPRALAQVRDGSDPEPVRLCASGDAWAGAARVPDAVSYWLAIRAHDPVRQYLIHQEAHELMFRSLLATIDKRSPRAAHLATQTQGRPFDLTAL